ncbi:hypothetical protein LINPERPRIM_LOCUS22054 [Linum perenne]
MSSHSTSAIALPSSLSIEASLTTP